MRHYAAAILAITLASYAAGAMTGAVLQLAWAGVSERAVDERHGDLDAEMEVFCAAMVVDATRVQRKASARLWAKRGPTGGEMPMVTTTEVE